MSLPVRITLYTKARCHLCEVAREDLEDLLEELAGEVHATIEEVDIASDPKLKAKWRLEIPVICVNGEPVCRFRVETEAMAAKLRNAAQEGESR